jgi:hypothetical protein
MAKITGSHSIIYSKNAGADKKFFKDIMKFANVDVGQGWLIFGLPPSEVAFHPHDSNDLHEFYLITDDIKSFVDEMEKMEIMCTPPTNQGWGIMTQLTLPGGGRLGVYEPRHARPGVTEAKVKKKVKAVKKKKVAAKVVKKSKVAKRKRRN